MADMGSQYGLTIGAYSCGRNRQEIIIGWAGVRGGFNFRILLVMYVYSVWGLSAHCFRLTFRILL